MYLLQYSKIKLLSVIYFKLQLYPYFCFGYITMPTNHNHLFLQDNSSTRSFTHSFVGYRLPRIAIFFTFRRNAMTKCFYQTYLRYNSLMTVWQCSCLQLFECDLLKLVCTKLKLLIVIVILCNYFYRFQHAKTHAKLQSNIAISIKVLVDFENGCNTK